MAVLSTYLNLGFLAKLDSKNKWYCTKLTVKNLQFSGIDFNKELDPLTVTVEDLFWWCVDKKNITKSGVYPEFYIYKYKEFPRDLIL